MTHDDALAWLDRRTNYERRGMPDQSDLRLDRMRLLMRRLHDPHLARPTIHLTGTKGKSSTARMLAAMLGASGARIGVHTSPHLVGIEERFSIDDQPAPRDSVPRLLERMLPAINLVDDELGPDQPGLTFFEITTAMAFLHFATEPVDWNVIEVGMGGRLDATNVVMPEVSVLTTIGLDHTKQLGNTTELIAGEKSGIIKPGRPAVSGVTEPGPRDVIRAAAAERGSRLVELNRDFRYRWRPNGLTGGRVEVTTWRRAWPSAELAMPGEHQGHNLALALATLDLLEERGRPLDPEAAIGAIRGLVIPGRVELVSRGPAIVLDAAHNPPSCEALVRTLVGMFPRSGPGSERWGSRTLIVACSRDKDWKAMLAILAPAFDRIIATEFSQNPRVLPLDTLLPSVREFHPRAEGIADPLAALARARASGKPAPAKETPTAPEPIIVIAGSFFLAAELRPELAKERPTAR
jgi:dihydrofolate synthase/folylpolyglutamate synthase